MERAVAMSGEAADSLEDSQTPDTTSLPAPTNITVDLRPGTKVFAYSPESGALEISTDVRNVVQIHAITPLVFSGYMMLPGFGVLGEFNCIITPHITHKFSASQFPKQISKELKELIQDQAQILSVVCTGEPAEDGWKVRSEVKHKGIVLLLDFFYTK